MYAHYCLHKFHKWPSEFLSLPRNERAFVIASIDTKVEDDKEAERKAKQQSR